MRRYRGMLVVFGTSLLGCQNLPVAKVDHRMKLIASHQRQSVEQSQRERTRVLSSAATPVPPPELIEIPLPQPATIRQVAAVAADDSAAPPARSRFAVPSELPGSDAPPILLPKIGENVPPAERRSAIEKLYQSLPVLPNGAALPSAVDAAPLSLSDLESIALQSHPRLTQAAADVNSAHGIALQAGLYPNPTVGYQSDTVGTASTNGYHGGFISQEFVTAGKLTLAQERALAEARQAELNQRKIRMEVLSGVRRNYYGVLVAQQRLRFAKALSQLTEEIYRAQIDLVVGGESAAYEPVQLRVLAVQARNEIVRSQNDLIAGWRKLAATLGQPDRPLGAVQGHVDQAAPRLDYDTARQWLESTHSDLAAAEVGVQGAARNLELQEATPYPNLTIAGVIQRDYTAPALNSMSYNLQIGIPIPVFDRNQGNIQSAEAGVIRAQQEWGNRRNALVAEFADQFREYQTATQLAEVYRSDLLPSQVQAYRGVYERFRSGAGDVDFAQIIVTQQSLSQVMSEYLRVLDEQWQALVDVAETLQLEDLSQLEQWGGAKTPQETGTSR